MVDQIKQLLQELEGVYGWKLLEVSKSAAEVFFVKKTLDMNRAVHTLKYVVTIYVKFEDGGETYLGQSTTEIAPTMTVGDIRTVLADTKLAASFVKNKPFELPKPSEETPTLEKVEFATAPLSTWIPKLTKALYKNDIYEEGGINSSEIFLNLKQVRLLNSEGIDVSYDTYESMVEVVADWNDGEEPVELFKIMDFGDYAPEVLAGHVADLILESKERAHAAKTPNLDGVRVILSGDAVKDFLRYYVIKSSARLKYEGISQNEIGQKLQGEDVTGDLVSIEMLPMLKGSSKSMPYDPDGMTIKPIQLVKDGELLALLGDSQFASYIGIEPTGQINNFKVDLGSTTHDEMTKEPYIELLSFSHFQMNFLTGDFGGEMRLARYFDGEKVSYLTGGSLSANIKEVQGNMKLSSEGTQHDNYVGPKHLLFTGLDIAGI